MRAPSISRFSTLITHLTAENDPIIPIDTPFILTTSLSAIPKVIPNAKESDKVIVALDRYFDRPDVLEKYRQQKEIQTPEFNKIDSPQVGSRMRPRNEVSTTFQHLPDTYRSIGLDGHVSGCI